MPLFKDYQAVELIKRGTNIVFRMPYDRQDMRTFFQRTSLVFMGYELIVPIAGVMSALEDVLQFYNKVDNRAGIELPAYVDAPCLAIFAHLQRIGAIITQHPFLVRDRVAYGGHTSVFLNDARNRQGDLIRMLGWYENPASSGRYSADSSWAREEGPMAFWDALKRALPALVERATDAATGATVERISAEALSEMWVRVRQLQFGEVPKTVGEKYYPPTAQASYWAACLLATIPGPAFVVADGYASRSLPPWPMQIPVAPQDMHVDGLNHALLTYAIYNGSDKKDGFALLLQLSVLGRSNQLVRALWAYIVDAKRGVITIPTDGRYNGTSARRQEGRRRYISMVNDTVLPESGYHHLLIEHVSNTGPVPGESFAHIVGNGYAESPEYDRFFRQLSTAVTIPFSEQDVDLMWTMGREASLIEDCQAVGCRAYWVRADERGWSEIRQAIGLGLTLKEFRRTRKLDLATFGDEEKKAGTPEIVVEAVEGGYEEEE